LQIGDDLPSVAALNGKEFKDASPRDVFTGPDMLAGLQGFGRFEIRMNPLAARGGVVEITALHTGQRVEFESLPPGASPPTAKAWAPLEFMAVVEPAGLAVPLVVVEGSRVDEVDVHFKNFLTQTYRIGQRLNPGFYRITVSP
jgi:hypothetical protein